MLCVLGAISAVARAQPAVVPALWRLQARVVAVGLPGVNGVRQVGRFHSGGPIPGNPEFLMRTEAGRVLDAQRVLVAVSSNFGAPLAVGDQAAGAVLSIDTGQPDTLVVPRDFAAAGAQAAVLGGAVQLYTAQAPAFLNRRYNPEARTALHAAAAGPRYLSINNAFGRPWIANAPAGPRGAGSVSVVDPDGAPLDNAPSATAGGVFAGHSTARETVPLAERNGLLASWFNHRASAQLTPGALAQGALGTAFLGPSPDGSGLAVFAVATADGAVTQVHVQDGVDGLAPPGTLGVGDGDPGVIGMAFKWNPLRALYLADAARNRLLILHLRDDRRHFTVARSEVIDSPDFHQPVDLVPAVPEVANPRFASHTTLAGGSDLYVANRGDGSLLRIDQHGRVLARARIELPGGTQVGPGRIRAIAVSADAQRLWLTLGGELPGFDGHVGALIEVSAFDAGGPFAPVREPASATPMAAVEPLQAQAQAKLGEQIFRKQFVPAEGLGPLFNARSCLSCHSTPSIGGMSSADEHFVRRVAHMDPASGRVIPIVHPNSPVARRHSTLELGVPDAPSAALPRQANVTSLRMPLSLYGVARLDDIPDAVIEAQAVAKGDGIKGRVHYVEGPDGEARVGRYGWKANTATLELMVANAFANELGLRSALARPLLAPVEDDGRLVRAVAAFLRQLRVPARGGAEP
jgi:hypothetical protein